MFSCWAVAMAEVQLCYTTLAFLHGVWMSRRKLLQHQLHIVVTRAMRRLAFASFRLRSRTYLAKMAHSIMVYLQKFSNIFMRLTCRMSLLKSRGLSGTFLLCRSVFPLNGANLEKS